MSISSRFLYTTLGMGMLLLVAGVATAGAETITSPSYKINGNLGGSFGGRATSTSYGMTAIGGEAIVGSGASGSYVIDQQVADPVIPSMQLTVQPSGLVGFYSMDENTGTTTADSSQYQNNATLKTTAAMGVSGKLGGAVDINGPIATQGNGSVNVPDHANLPSGSQMTFEAWINTRDNTIYRTIASHYADNDHGWRIAHNGNNIQVLIASTAVDSANNGIYTTSNEITANTWNHVAVVYDGSLSQADKVKVYINGVRKATSTFGAFPSSLRNSTGQLSIGSQGGTVNAFAGLIDHVKLFNRALTSEEISAEYSAQNAGQSSGLALNISLFQEDGSGGGDAAFSDLIVRTSESAYNVAVAQNHDLQYDAHTIPSFVGTIADPVLWEFTGSGLFGFGFTIDNAPTNDPKWDGGANYAKFPSSATTVYSTTDHVPNVVDVIKVKIRADVTTSQPVGEYTNTITYTGTMTP